MIVDAIITILVGLLGGILAVLPAWSMPTLLTSTWPGDIASAVGWANGFFPVYDLGLSLAILLGIRVLMSAWKIAVWLYDRFPFKFT